MAVINLLTVMQADTDAGLNVNRFRVTRASENVTTSLYNMVLYLPDLNTRQMFNCANSRA